MRILLLLLLSLLPLQLFSQTKYCSRIDGEIIIVKKYIVISYNPEKKIPNYVGYYLVPYMLYGDAKREASFYTEVELPVWCRSKSSDYTNSGYDRGHMAPAADWKFSQNAMHDSFSMANISPQARILNRQYWEELEEYERYWAEMCDTLFIVSGEICNNDNVLRNNVGVPSYFYKTIVGVRGHEIVIAKGWIFNNDNSPQPFNEHEHPIDEIEYIIKSDIYCGFWFNNKLKE